MPKKAGQTPVRSDDTAALARDHDADVAAFRDMLERRPRRLPPRRTREEAGRARAGVSPPGKLPLGPHIRDHQTAGPVQDSADEAATVNKAEIDTAPFTRKQAEAVKYNLRELARDSGKHPARVVARWWRPLCGAAEWCVATIEVEAGEQLKIEARKGTHRPRAKLDRNRWQRLKRVTKFGRVDVLKYRRAIVTARKHGDYVQVLELEADLSVLRLGAEIAGCTPNLHRLRGADLCAAYDAARQSPLLVDEGHRREGALDGYLAFLARVFKEITGEEPTAGTTYSANNPERSGCPGTPASRFFMAACSFLPLRLDQINGWIKTRG
jgi:hypothetical protein